MRTTYDRKTLLLAALLSYATAARGAEVQINPLIVNLGPRARSGLVTIHNIGAEPVQYEVQVKAWDQGAGGEMLLSPTEEVLAFPPLMSIAPGDERNVRVGTVVRADKAASERTYRLILQEVPPPERPHETTGVRVLSRIALPIFIAPASAVERSSVADLTVRDGKVRFRLRNEGNVHVRPSSVKLVGKTADGTTLVQKDLEAWYVLGAGERRFEVELPRDACRRLTGVSVDVDLGGRSLHASAPEVGCAVE